MERSGVSGADEDAGADDAADAEEDQIPWPQGALQFAGPGFFLDVGDALAQPDPAQKAPLRRCGGHGYYPLGLYLSLAAEPNVSNGAGNPLCERFSGPTLPTWVRAVRRRRYGRGDGRLPGP